ncbi:MAG: class I SAM-dependent methyltransferase [Proteobacteria bacterium]|nr:class I SAM-dependent methyltransferase [Pseudomonadota bacterium]
MRRVHGFEFEDQAWCPAALRDPATAYLRFVVEKSGQAHYLAEKLAPFVRETGATEWIDLGSGGGGPVVAVARALSELGLPVRVRLTDLYPHADAFARLAAEAPETVRYEAEPVDAADVPASQRGLRTLFNVFHHFRPELARRVLQNAVDARAPVAVFELVERSVPSVLGMFATPLPVALSMPFLRPFRWTQLLFTYVIPLIPLLVIWDGVVSCLRVYSPAELEELVASLDAPDYEFEVGRLPLGRFPVQATYLIGRPVGD